MYALSAFVCADIRTWRMIIVVRYTRICTSMRESVRLVRFLYVYVYRKGIPALNYACVVSTYVVLGNTYNHLPIYYTYRLRKF